MPRCLAGGPLIHNRQMVEQLRREGITETEVTVEQFRRFRKDFEGTSAFAPYAAGVSWHDAVEFCRWRWVSSWRTRRLR